MSHEPQPSPVAHPLALVVTGGREAAVALGRLPSYPWMRAVRAPVDLAVGKRARFRDPDRSDRARRARRGLLHGLPFQQWVEEARGDSIGDGRWLRYDPRDALAPIDAKAPAPVPRRSSAPRSFRPRVGAPAGGGLPQRGHPGRPRLRDGAGAGGARPAGRRDAEGEGEGGGDRRWSHPISS